LQEPDSDSSGIGFFFFGAGECQPNASAIRITPPVEWDIFKNLHCPNASNMGNCEENACARTQLLGCIVRAVSAQ